MGKIGKLSIDGIIHSIYDAIYPVGSIYISVYSTNPSSLFGGTWERFANGRCLVGVSESETEFSTVLKTGGEKAHQTTIEETANHEHRVRDSELTNYFMPTYDNQVEDNSWGAHIVEGVYGYKVKPGVPERVGGNKPHNNLQPYITVYMWKRIN